MFIPYPDTTKELYYEDDYTPIQDRINTFRLHEIPGILENLYNALDNAYEYHAELLEQALYSDIAALKKKYVILFVFSCSSGTIAGYIGNSKHTAIEKAVDNTIIWASRKATVADLYTIDIDPEGIKAVVNKCYRMNIAVS